MGCVCGYDRSIAIMSGRMILFITELMMGGLPGAEYSGRVQP